MGHGQGARERSLRGRAEGSVGANARATLPPSVPAWLGFIMSRHASPLKRRQVPRPKDRTAQQAKMTVSPQSAQSALSRPAAAWAPMTPSGARSTLPWGWGGRKMGSPAKVTLWKESRGARPGRRREAGSRAHACFPTHSPHGLHRRGAPTTGTHEHAGTKPADQESTTEGP